jgi:hypothetical protein
VTNSELEKIALIFATKFPDNATVRETLKAINVACADPSSGVSTTMNTDANLATVFQARVLIMFATMEPVSVPV